MTGGFWLFAQQCRSDGATNVVPDSALAMTVSDRWNALSQSERQHWKDCAGKVKPVQSAGRTHFKNNKSKKQIEDAKLEKQNEMEKPHLESPPCASFSSSEESDDDGDEETGDEETTIITSSEDMEYKRDRDLSSFTFMCERFNEDEVLGVPLPDHLCDMNHALLFVEPHCQSSDLESCVPAELALVIFNVTDGITDERNWLLPLPKDMPEYAVKQAEANYKLHKIPMDASDLADGDFARSINQVVTEMEDLLDSAGVKRLLVPSTPRKYYNDLMGALHYLTSKRIHEKNLKSRLVGANLVRTIDGLVYCYVQTLGAKKLDEGAKMQVTKNLAVDAALDRKKPYWCLFHESHPAKDVGHCALLCAKAVIYKVFIQIHEVHEFEITDAHRPPRVICPEGQATLRFAEEQMTEKTAQLSVNKQHASV